MTDPRRPYGVRLAEQIALRGNLCIGIDPHPALLAEWDLASSASGVGEFGRRVVEAAQAVGVAAVKPQVAFFEAYGSVGFAALERVLREARDAGLIVVADAKRGDIGSSNAGYAAAWLRAESPFYCDALTVSPYLGVRALADIAHEALDSGRGVYVLAATSNPEAAEVQTAWVTGGGDEGHEGTIASSVLRVAEVWNSAEVGEVGIGSAGVVLGATLDLNARGIDPQRLPATVPILAPGFGAQGAILADVYRIFPDASERLLASVSRSVLAGPRDALADRIRAAQAEVGAAS